MVTLTLPLIEAAHLAPPGCTAWTVTATDGSPLGNCHAIDETGFKFCYARKGTPACVDEMPSKTFAEYCHAHAPCRIYGYVHPDGTFNDEKAMLQV